MICIDCDEMNIKKLTETNDNQTSDLHHNIASSYETT